MKTGRSLRSRPGVLLFANSSPDLPLCLVEEVDPAALVQNFELVVRLAEHQTDGRVDSHQVALGDCERSFEESLLDLLLRKLFLREKILLLHDACLLAGSRPAHPSTP